MAHDETELSGRRVAQRRAVIVVAVFIASASKIWIAMLDRSECGRFSSLVDSRLLNSLVLASHASALALLFLAASGRHWDGVGHARKKRGLTAMVGLAVGIAGVLSWAQMNYRCHGS